MLRMTAVEMAAAGPVGALGVVLTCGVWRGEAGVTVSVSGLAAQAVDLADVRGNVRVFANAGDALLEAVKILQVESGEYGVTLHSGGYLLADLPVDLVKDAESRKTKLTAVRVKNVASGEATAAQVAAINAWGVRSAAQGARLAELTAQLAALASERVSIDAQLHDLDEVIAAAA